MGKVPSSSLPLAARRSISVRESNPSFASAESLRRSSSAHPERTPFIEVGLKGSIFSLIDREVCSPQPSEAPAAAAVCCQSAPPKNPWQLGWIMIIRNGSRRNPGGSHQSQGKLQAEAEGERTVKVAEAAAAAGRVPKWKRLLHRVKGGAPRSGSALKLGFSGTQAGVPLEARPHVKPTDSRLIWERRNVAQVDPLQLRHHHGARARACARARTRMLA